MSKRIFDLFFSFILVSILLVPMCICALVLFFDMGNSPIFIQKRIGQYGKKFVILKFRTIHPQTSKISKFSAILRKYKIDELPQLFNILIGQMSLVGPRPDIPGYYDLLEGESRKILELKPGLTSEASLKYVHEEKLLVDQIDPLSYNDTIIFPDKIKMNLWYYYNQTILLDLRIILKTILQVLKKS